MNFKKLIPEGDTHERNVCGDCNFIQYENPKVIVQTVVTYKGKYLLCKRGIEPRKGYWTIPGGYMELGEDVETGAIREVFEETNATVIIDRLLCVFSLPTRGQVHLVFTAEMVDDTHFPGIESLDTGLFSFRDIPFTEIAFPLIKTSLERHRIVGSDTSSQPLIRVQP